MDKEHPLRKRLREHFENHPEDTQPAMSDRTQRLGARISRETISNVLRGVTNPDARTVKMLNLAIDEYQRELPLSERVSRLEDHVSHILRSLDLDTDAGRSERSDPR